MGSTGIRKHAIKSSHLRGFSLAMTLVFAVILLLIGIVITGLTTMQSRYSLERNSDIITRQAAVAGVNKVQQVLAGLDELNNAGTAVDNLNGFLPDTGAFYCIKLLTPIISENIVKNIEIESHGFFRRDASRSIYDTDNRSYEKVIRMAFIIKDPMRAISATGKDRPMKFSNLGSYLDSANTANKTVFQDLKARINAVHSLNYQTFSYYKVFVSNTDIHGNIGTDLLPELEILPEQTPVLLTSVRVLKQSSETDWSNQTVNVHVPEDASGALNAKIIPNGIIPDPQQTIKEKKVKDYITLKIPETKNKYPKISNPDLIINNSDPACHIVTAVGSSSYEKIELNGNVTLKLRGGIRYVDTFIASATSEPVILDAADLNDPDNPAVFVIKKRLELNNVHINVKENAAPNPNITSSQELKHPSCIFFYINEKYTEGIDTKYCSAVITNSECNCTFAGKADVFIGSTGSERCLIKGSVTGNTVTVTGASSAADCCKVEYRSSYAKKIPVLNTWEEL
ncbi:MAG: hypothetical protein AB2L14_35665 [Candidatus Xenobiia bacterium LiM19]